MEEMYYCRDERNEQMRPRVFIVTILDPKNNYEIAGFCGVYDSYDTAAAQLDYSFNRGFIECTGVPDIYVNCEGELLVIVEKEIGTMEDLC